MNSVNLVHDFAFGFYFIKMHLFFSTNKCKDSFFRETGTAALLGCSCKAILRFFSLVFISLRSLLIYKAAKTSVIVHRMLASSLGCNLVLLRSTEPSIRNCMILYHPIPDYVLPRDASGLTTRGWG